MHDAERPHGRFRAPLPKLGVDRVHERVAEAARAGVENGVDALETIEVVVDAIEEERVEGLAENE